VVVFFEFSVVVKIGKLMVSANWEFWKYVRKKINGLTFWGDWGTLGDFRTRQAAK
jgi:hypothetical protein